MIKRTAFALCALALLSIALLSACAENETPKAEASDEALIQRGEYLVTVLGCHDCHSPKRMGANRPELIPELHLSGYPADRPVGEIPADVLQNGWTLFNADLTMGVGPWGVSFAANITSDQSGIGSWSLTQFKRALRQGKSKGLETGRTLLPPMPWFNYVNMKDEDVEAIFKFLQSTRPVKNIVPAPLPPAPQG